MSSKKIRVLIVDDSLFMRAAIAKTLPPAQFEIAGQAKDGKDALDKIASLTPDVVTMDFNMPGMNGAETVRAIMQQRPTPVVMFSAHTRQGARETFDALAAGAVDFVTKPSGEVSIDLSAISEELTRKLTAAATAKPRAASTVIPTRLSGPITIPRTTLTGSLPRLCVIAVSTGGPAALSELLPALPADLRLAMVIVQHMPAHFTAGERPMPGTVLIAPGDKHVEFDDNGAIVLTDGPLVNGCRPAADVTMMSAARVYGRRTVAVVMTGMGRDGAAGAQAIKRAEGKTLAQDQATSVIFGMPKAAVDTGAIDEVCALGDIASWLRYA